MSENKEVAVIPSAILLPQKTVNLIALPRPFSRDQIVRAMPAGSTIADMLRAIGLNPGPLFARVFIDDRLILKAEWEFATPKAGQMVTARVIPTGGGESGKDTLRIVAQIGVMILATVAAAYGGPLAFIAVSIAGTLIVNGPIPHPLPRRNTLLSIEERRRKEAT